MFVEALLCLYRKIVQCNATKVCCMSIKILTLLPGSLSYINMYSQSAELRLVLTK